MDTLTAPRTTEVGAQGGFADSPSWPAIAAWGGGLVQLALGAGAVTAVDGSLAIRMAGFVLIVMGAAAIGWGAATLARGRIVVPRLVVGGSLAGIFSAVAAMTLDPQRTSVFAVVAASALLIAVALGSALALRRAGRPARARRTDVARPRLIGLVVSAVLVAGVVTPALAATEAGQHAVPHASTARLSIPATTEPYSTGVAFRCSAPLSGRSIPPWRRAHGRPPLPHEERRAARPGTRWPIRRPAAASMSAPRLRSSFATPRYWRSRLGGAESRSRQPFVLPSR